MGIQPTQANSAALIGAAWCRVEPSAVMAPCRLCNPGRRSEGLFRPWAAACPSALPAVVLHCPFLTDDPQATSTRPSRLHPSAASATMLCRGNPPNCIRPIKKLPPRWASGRELDVYGDRVLQIRSAVPGLRAARPERPSSCERPASSWRPSSQQASW